MSAFYISWKEKDIAQEQLNTLGFFFLKKKDVIISTEKHENFSFINRCKVIDDMIEIKQES
jgi:hypothetical protein